MVGGPQVETAEPGHGLRADRARKREQTKRKRSPAQNLLSNETSVGTTGCDHELPPPMQTHRV